MDGNWTLTAFFYDHFSILLAAALGLLGGGLIAGWLVRSRLKNRFERLLADATTEQRLLQERQLTLQEMTDQLRIQVIECEAESRRRQQEKETLQTANAALEAHLQQIPALEKTLDEVRNQSDRVQAELRRESAALAKAQEKGDRLVRVEEDLARKEQVRILLLSSYYPSSGIVAAKEVPVEVREKVKAAMLAFRPQGQHASGLYHWYKTEMPLGFVEAKDSDYRMLRSWIDRLQLGFIKLLQKTLKTKT